MADLTSTDKVMCAAASLARELGASDREIARACMGVASGIAEATDAVQSANRSRPGFFR
jgi:hypothetical protein